MKGYIYYTRKIKRLACKVKLLGTVCSGNATATTLGNTCRVKYYVKLAAQLGFVPETEYRSFVAGDDVLLIINRRYVDNMRMGLS